MSQFKKSSVVLLSATMLGIQGCLDSSSDGVGEQGDNLTIQTALLNASATGSGSAPAHLNLANGSTVTAEGDWHFAYQRFVGFKTNSGFSGSGHVKSCIAHQFADLYDEQGQPVKAAFEAKTLENTLAGFEGVTKTSCTPEQVDTLKTQLSSSGWWSQNPDYDMASGVISGPNEAKNRWILRSASKNGDTYQYARIGFKEFKTRSSEITLTLEKWSGTSWDAAMDSVPINFSGAPAYWDLETNSLVSDSDDWEIRFESANRSTNIQLNGGVSGSGSAGIGQLVGDNPDARNVTNPTDINQVPVFAADTVVSTLSEPGSYGAFHYAVGGGNHAMWPTFTTYLFEDQGRYFKAQVISNTGSTGSDPSGNLVVRYAELP